MTEDFLLQVIEEDGIFLDNKEEVRNELRECLFENRFMFIRNDWEEVIGFFTWWEKFEHGKLYIFINNLFIKKEHQTEFNLCRLRKWFREKYPNAEKFYWRSRKKQEYFYCH